MLPRRTTMYPMLLAVGALLAADPVSAAPTAQTVPWVATNPVISHDIVSGKSTRLKGICTGCTQFSWNYGDGSPASAFAAVSSTYNLESSHTYTGSVGQTFTAVLTVKDAGGATATSNYYVTLRDGTNLQVKVNIAIDEGLWYLHKTMTRGAFGAGAQGFGQTYGLWNSGNAGSGYVSNQAANINSFEVNGHLEAGPATDPYSETVGRAMRYMLTQLRVDAIPATVTNPQGVVTLLSTTDDGGNRYSVGVNQGPEMYQLGALMDAIVASGTPNAVSVTGLAASGGNPGVVGRKYIDIVRGMVNRYAYCQTYSGSGGGWFYECRQNANDNSICQWASIGMIAATDWGIVLPPAMVKWNQVWLQNDQETTTNSATRGGFGYTFATQYLWGPYAVTPSGMVQMTMSGIGRGSLTAGATGMSTAGGPSWEWTETLMRNNFGNPVANGAGGAPRAYYYGLFSFVKSMLLHNTNGVPGSSPITLLHSQTAGVTDVDWYADPTIGVAPTLVGTQDPSGYWYGHNYSGAQYSFETAWCIIMLSKTLFTAGAPVAVATAGPNPALPTDSISFDGSQSYQQDPTKHIVQWDWDFLNNGTTNASGVQVSYVYPNAQFGATVTAKLTVTDNVGTKASTTVTITFKQPPVPPTARAGGPYTFCMNITPFFLDGSGSFVSDAGTKDPTCPNCPVKAIISYGWDLNGLNTFNDATGAQPNVTSTYMSKGAGSYLVQLKVTDNTATSWPNAGVGNLTSVASSQVTVRANCVCITDLVAAINGNNQPQLAWSPDGSALFNVYRSTVSGGPYTKIATVNGAAPGYVDTSATAGNTYYYIVRSATLAGNETCQSAQVTATVNKLPTTTVLTSSANPSTYGQTITLTATVAPSAVTGSVTFLDGGNMIGNGTVSNGVATMTTSVLTTGSHNLSAVYSGDATYLGSTGTLTQLVNKVQSTLTWPQPASIVYGTPISGTQLNATASVPGTMAYSVSLGAILPVQTLTLSVTFTPTDAVNYSTATATVSLTILPKPASVTPDPNGKVYGAADPVLTGTLAGFLPADNVTAAYSRTAGQTAGAYTISATLAPAGVLGNYTIAYNTATFTINRAPLSATANSASRFYQSPNPPLTGTLTGVIAGDGITATYTTTATVASAPGGYPITPVLSDPNGRLGNYNVTITPATLTVIAAPIVVVSPDPLAFGSQNLMSSVTLNVTVQNIGTAPLLISSVAISGANAGDFSVVNGCGTTLAVNASCFLPVTFVPHALGAKTAVLTVTDNNGGYPGSQQSVNLTGSSLLRYGLYATSPGCGSIQFTGQTFTDSYDSSVGAYAVSKASTGGDIAAQGNAFMSGQAVIYGKLFASNTTTGACTNGNTGVTINGQAKVTEGIFLLPPTNFTTPGPFTAGTTDVRINNNASITPGSYRTIQLSGKGTVLTLAPGVYNVNSIKLSGDVKIVVSPAGPVVINVAGVGDDTPIDLSGGTVAGTNNIPANLIVYYGGTGTIKLTSGGAGYGILYAPKAPAMLEGKAGEWLGSVVVASLKDAGQSAIHFDRALGR